MERKERDRKRKQQAIERVRNASQLFENEMKKAEKFKSYEPDLDDLEAMARTFETLAKSMKKMNSKALKLKGYMWREEDDTATKGYIES